MSSKRRIILSTIIISLVVSISFISGMVGCKSSSPRSQGVADVFSVDSAGRLIATSDGKATLEVPESALIDQTDISITPIKNSAIAGYNMVSAYQFEPEGTCFQMPVTLKITYNPDTLPSGLNESDLRLFVNVPAGVGELDNSSVDLENHVVSGQILHFSSFFMGTYSALVGAKVGKAPPFICGVWARQDGAEWYSFANDKDKSALVCLQPPNRQTIYKGWWENDGSNGYKYIIRWTHSPPGRAPFVDYVTVAADGQSYSGKSNYNDQVHCSRDNTPPRAKFEVSSSGGFKVGKLINLNGSESWPNTEDFFGNKSVYEWAVTSPEKKLVPTSDLTGSGGVVTTIIPTVPGDYIVKLTVTDAWGGSDDTSKILTIMPDVDISLSAIAGKYGPELDWTVTNHGIYFVEVTTKTDLAVYTPNSKSGESTEFLHVQTSFRVEGGKTVTIAQQTANEYIQVKGTVQIITWWGEVYYDHKTYPYSLSWNRYYNDPNRPGGDSSTVDLPIGK